ncbi:MAG: hypothetical protein ACHQ6U_02900 [Thermodesulfobacteriota bacterium]
MKEVNEELLKIAEHLEIYRELSEKPEVKSPLESLDMAATDVGKSWSGSWLGYLSKIYYKNLDPPPANAHFSQEWGFMRTSFVQGSVGEWQECDEDGIKEAIYKLADNPDLSFAEKLCEDAENSFNDKKQEILSLLSIANPKQLDPFLTSLEEQVKVLKIYSKYEIIRGLQPSGKLYSRDSLAVTQGLQTPPHIAVLIDIMSLRQPPEICLKLSLIARKAGSHVSRLDSTKSRMEKIGTNVFIGHGGSQIWRELKDYIQYRLRLPWDEFNRVPVAGITNIARLSEMLDLAAIAFLVMTAEDEHADG